LIIGFQDTVENVGDVFLGHSVLLQLKNYNYKTTKTTTATATMTEQQLLVYYYYSCT